MSESGNEPRETAEPLDVIEVVTATVEDDGTVVVDDVAAAVAADGTVVAADETIVVEGPDGTVVVEEVVLVDDGDGNLVPVAEATEISGPRRLTAGRLVLVIAVGAVGVLIFARGRRRRRRA